MWQQGLIPDPIFSFYFNPYDLTLLDQITPFFSDLEIPMFIQVENSSWVEQILTDIPVQLLM